MKVEDLFSEDLFSGPDLLEDERGGEKEEDDLQCSVIFEETGNISALHYGSGVHCSLKLFMIHREYNNVAILH